MTTKRKQAARSSSPAKTPAATEPKRSTRASASKATSEDASSPSKRNEVSVKKIKVTDESDFVDEPEVKELADANANSSKASPSAKASLKKNSKKEKKGKKVQESKESSDVADEPDQIELGEGEFEDEELANGGQGEKPDSLQRKPKRREGKVKEEEVDCLLMDPIPEAEARSRWPNRFAIKAKALAKGGSRSSNGDDDDSDILIEAKCHYRQARVDGYEYKLGDDAYVQAGEGEDNYICKILEMFEAVDGVPYFRAQWFYRAQDTVISAQLKELVKQDANRVFFSEVQDDNNLDCLVKRLNIARLPSNMDVKKKENIIKNCDYYFDMLYLLPHCTFLSVGPDDAEVSVSDSGSTISSDADANATVISGVDVLEGTNKVEMTMLDLYSGCGAMSTGLCLGSNSAGVKLVTKWALDLNEHACDSLRWNHPETEVRNEYAHDFLQLLREWQQLCASFSLVESTPHPKVNPSSEVEEDDEDEEDGEDEEDDDSEVFEVEKVLGICYGSPDDKKAGLYFKIKWKGYGPTYDTWEPIEGLSGCPAKLKEFVTESYEKKLLPLPGMVDVICGGPPCQGISGFNRFRDSKNPLRDEKNKQIIVYMDIVQFLKPRFVLMENVVDLFKFSGAHLGRYAFARLVQMNYQARVGLMAAGAYGLAQFRMRAFVWAALPSEKLPQYPLPTHDVVVRGNVPKEFEACFVAYEEGSKPKLEDKLFLADIISDLPPVKNNESSDEMAYGGPAKTEFQQFIRLRKDEMPGSLNYGLEPVPHMLFDHRPLRLNVDDYTRVCRIPKKKGANFRDLPGLKVIENKVELDPTVQRELLASGKPLVPDYAITFVRGTSSKPFGRLWWDETVPTVVTRAEPHNQIILHPEQDRVLSIRENARLQGFPDYYKLFGPIKQRYMQVGNAVAVPVARALGHSLALAVKGQSTKAPVFILPKGYPLSLEGN